jgi:FtsH-binding integral membrane protein
VVRGVAKLCTYHEYRLSLGLAAIAGIMTGLADAAIDDWAVKAFTWAAILMLYALIVSYELIVMPTPPKPLLQALLFTLTAPLGLLSAHHFTWYTLTVMLGKPIILHSIPDHSKLYVV